MMREPLIHLLERTTFLGSIARFHRTGRLKKKFLSWQAMGAALPMPDWGKQSLVIDYISKFAPEVFIETGTYKGRMVYAIMPFVREIYSIELDQKRYETAASRFAGYPNVHILQGSSGSVLPEILARINKKCLFWLDAHSPLSSTAQNDLETPVMQEMKCIFNHKRAADHIILIDDARNFTLKRDYPALMTLKQFVLERYPNWTFDVKDDIIRIHSPEKMSV